jgi:hypothetical protein
MHTIVQPARPASFINVLALCALLMGLIPCGPAGGEAQAQTLEKRMKSLSKENRKLEGNPAPNSRTKTYVRISQLMLTFVQDAVQAGDFELLERQTNEYRTAIETAYQTLIENRNPQKHGRDYRDMEIALRRQQRQLADICALLPNNRRRPVEAAREGVGAMRTDVLVALFGDAIRSQDGISSREN